MLSFSKWLLFFQFPERTFLLTNSRQWNIKPQFTLWADIIPSTFPNSEYRGTIHQSNALLERLMGQAILYLLYSFQIRYPSEIVLSLFIHTLQTTQGTFPRMPILQFWAHTTEIGEKDNFGSHSESQKLHRGQNYHYALIWLHKISHLWNLLGPVFSNTFSKKIHQNWILIKSHHEAGSSNMRLPSCHFKGSFKKY